MLARLIVLIPLCFYQISADSPYSGDGLQIDDTSCSLRIRAHTIDWETELNNCHNTPYQRVSNAPKGLRVYQLMTRNRACRLRVIEVQHGTGSRSRIWVVTGYTTVAAWRKNDFMSGVSVCRFDTDTPDSL